MKFDQSPYWHAAVGLPVSVCAGQTFATVDLDDSEGEGDFGQQNFALHVGDDAQKVQLRRVQLLQQLSGFGVKQLQWLNQTHSTTAYRITHPMLQLQEGDGLVTQQQGVALMMMTADCLPIVVSNAQGTEVACLHAGWRGLANGIIESTLAKMHTVPAMAWIGAAISQPHFEVGAEVKAIFVEKNAAFEQDFMAQPNHKYLADLYAIATKTLHGLGLMQVTGAEHCSFAEVQKFYSYRRQAQTGRMATFVFIAEKNADDVEVSGAHAPIRPDQR